MKLVAAYTVLMSIMLLGCSSQKKNEEGQPPTLSSQSQNVAGVQWSIPANWTKGPEKQMRVGTYLVKGSDDNAEQGECAVFYFGEGQGGNVEANIDRWFAQFENRTNEERKKEEFNGIKVTTVSVQGNYLSPGGPMMESQGTKEKHSLCGAIVEAPGGMVFFKFTGPTPLVDGASKDFRAMLQSLSKSVAG
jgi:hypothetical protein